MEVVDVNQGYVESGSEALGEGAADEQGAEQSGPAGVGDGRQVLFLDFGLPQGLADYRHDVLLVCAAGEFGDYAAVEFVYPLTGDDVAQQQSVTQDCRRGVVAG